MRLHSSHSLTMRPHRIQVSSSRCDRLEEAEELDTSEEPLLRREPLIDRMDLESASSNLREETVYEDGKLKLQLIFSDGKGACLHGTACLSYTRWHTHWRVTGKLRWALGRYDIEADCNTARTSTVCGQPCRGTRSLRACYLKLQNQRLTNEDITHTQMAGYEHFKLTKNNNTPLYTESVRVSYGSFLGGGPLTQLPVSQTDIEQ